MIGRVLPRGQNVRGVLHYLYGKGKQNQHVNPHLVAGWIHPADLEPARRADGSRNFSRLTGLLELPVQLARGKVAREFVYHLVLRCAPEDPDLGDGAWNAIATEVMDRTGLSERGREDQGVRWIAVHHGENHIHIVATLAGQDREPVWPRNDFYRIGEALRGIEREYGLRVLDRADRTAPKVLTRAEMEQSGRSGREPDRAVLYRHVRAAAAAARSEPEFFAAVEARGVLVHLRYSAVRPGEVTGYAVAVDHGPDRRPVWFSGGKLAADLTLPKLRRRWAGPRLTGRGMGDPPTRTVLAREALQAGRAARSEPEFFALLERAGLLARLRAAPGQAGPGRPAGWSVTLPGLTDRAGRPVWFTGGTLDPVLRLDELRARWRAGQPGAGPGPGLFTGAARSQIYEHAARAAAAAARELAGGRAGRADVARAAADLLTAAAEATGNPELARAAEAFTRAARAAWGRTPTPSPDGSMLRTAAYLIASSRRTRQPHRAVRVMLTALADLARTLAGLRASQGRRLQAAAAAAAATRLTDVAATIDYGQTIPQLAATDFPRHPFTARPSPAAGSTPHRRSGPIPPQSPRRPHRGI